jgi:hypothetical protein
VQIREVKNFELLENSKIRIATFSSKHIFINILVNIYIISNKLPT